MKQLTKNELEEVDRLWDELSRLFPSLGPPLTDDEVIAAGADSLLAGIVSSNGGVGREGLALCEVVLSDDAQSPALQEILARLALVLGMGQEPQGRARS